MVKKLFERVKEYIPDFSTKAYANLLYELWEKKLKLVGQKQTMEDNVGKMKYDSIDIDKET